MKFDKLATEGLTTEELARAKKKLIGQQQIANQSNDAFGYIARSTSFTDWASIITSNSSTM